MALRSIIHCPSRCAVCQSWPSVPICDSCVASLAHLQARCRRCALPLAAPATICGQCVILPPPLDACYAAVPYAYPWSGLIAAFKFQQQAGWARHLSRLLRSVPWVEPTLEKADWVLPMPLSARRLQQRGYNQAWELAKHLLPRSTRPKLRADFLLRLIDTPAQASLTLGARKRNVAGAFAVEPKHAPLLVGRHVVLVDDVMTSGASLYSAAQVLRAAGTASVTALALARTDPTDWPDNAG